MSQNPFIILKEGWKPLTLGMLIAFSQTACNSDSSDSVSSSATETTGESTDVTVASDSGLFIFNRAPEVTSLLLAVDETNDHLVSLAAIDEDGDSLTWEIITQPENGILSGVAPHLTYSPNRGFSGTDSFQVQVSDGQLKSEVTTIALVVRKLNDRPVANAQSLSMEKDTTLSLTLDGSDIDGDPLTFVLETLPEQGKLTGSVPSFVYEPDLGFEGTDYFTFSVNDGMEISTTATVEITVSYPSRPINDTGITYGGNHPSDNNDSCIGETPEAQDCSHGRDFTDGDADDGHAGFSFTKLSDDGTELPANATEWSCVKDNITGLVWEVKTESDDVIGAVSLNDADDTFNWFNEDDSANNGNIGYDNDDGATCFGYDENTASTFCNTQAFVARMNEAAFCGFTDWRMPQRQELGSIANLNDPERLVDANYFPGTKAALYWTGTPSQSSRTSAYTLDFFTGDVMYKNRRETFHVRLVRSDWE